MFSERQRRESLHARPADETVGKDTFRSVLGKAEGHGKAFRWNRAADVFAGFLAATRHLDLLIRGEGFEWVALYRYRSALQSQTAKGFAQDIRRALSSQRRASECFGKLEATGRAQFLRSRALEAFLAHWLAKSPAEKKRLLDTSWSITMRSLRLFESNKRHTDYVQTFNQLSFGAALSIENDRSLRSRLRRTSEALQAGRKALHRVASLGNREEHAETLVKISILLNGLADDSSDSSKHREYRREALQLWEEALKLDRKTALREISHPLSGSYQSPDPSLNLKLCNEALEIAKPGHDNFAIGRLMDFLAKWTCYAAQFSESGENPAVGREMYVTALHYAEEAGKRYDTINFTSPIAGVLWVHSPYAEHFQQLSKYENDPDRRRLLLEKGLGCTGELLRLARQSGNLRVMFYAFHVSNKLESLLAGIETGKKRKRELLQRALSHSLQAYELVGRVGPSTSFNRGMTIRGVADVQSKLAELEAGSKREVKLLRDAARKLEEGLKIMTSFAKAIERPEDNRFAYQIGLYRREYGDILKRLASHAKSEEYLRDAANEYSAAAEWYGRVPRYDGLAESYWKLAEIYDRLRAHSLASETFTLAARAYSKLGHRVPPLKEHSKSYARYLMAWSQIELARAFHARLQYRLAAASYNSASRLHRSNKRWRFLGPYYSAWSKLEWGEHLSKQGRRVPATIAFHQAAALFSESRIQLRDRLASSDEPDEKAMATKLLNAPRAEFCHAREILEEAAVAESQEDYRSSFEKFGLASKKLRESLSLSESEQDGQELAFLLSLCEAWRLSCRAEIEDSIEQLQEACTQFERAKNLSSSQSELKLASGHHAFCKALISSRNFAETKDLSFQNEASSQLDLAAGYYLESGFKAASAHAMARKFLLEAFVQLNMAGTEQNHERKAGLYRMTSALLRESARAFLRAHQQRKADLAFTLLAKANIESKIASNLNNILEAALSAPTNVAFHTRTQGNEEPFGLDRFEQGDIEGRLSKVKMASTPERDVELEIEITNTGRQPIRLVSLDGAIPDGTELIEPPIGWSAKGQSLLGPLRRIDTLQTETIKTIFRPGEEGLLKIHPKVTFVDAAGIQLERAIEPRTVVTSRILEFLAQSFLRDYTRRLAIPSCGWRTLMMIVHGLNIPRSHVYGEARYGRVFGRQLATLIKSSLIEYRIFPRERGRGGDITKVRVSLENESVRRYIEELTPEEPGSLTLSTLFRVGSAGRQIDLESAH